MKKYQPIAVVLILVLFFSSFNYVSLAQTITPETELTNQSLPERVQRDFEVINELLDNIRQQAALAAENQLTDFSAKNLATLAHAPKGYPLRQKVTVTSSFGWRDSIKGEIEAEKEQKEQKEQKENEAGKGGNAVVTQTIAPATPVPATATPAAESTPLPVPATTDTPATTAPASAPETTATTPELPPTTPAATPAPETTATPAATIEATATPVVTPTPEVAPTGTGTVTPVPVTTSKTVSLWGNEVVVTQTVGPAPTPTATTAPVPARELHSGIDLGAVEGTPVLATADGVVEYAGGERGGYGLVVFLTNSGSFTTIYGHNSQLLVKAGQRVKAGDVIAISGNTGYSTGPHVHYEIRFRGQAVDPAPFLEVAKVASEEN